MDNTPAPLLDTPTSQHVPLLAELLSLPAPPNATRTIFPQRP